MPMSRLPIGTREGRRFKKNILLTGRPRVGKSTIIQRVVERLRGAGFKDIGGISILPYINLDLLWFYLLYLWEMDLKDSVFV